MTLVRILVDSLADDDLLNAQMGNAREIMARLDRRFHVTTFSVGTPDPRLAERPATRLIRLPQHRQTAKILNEFLWGRHDILFYLKSSPAARLYLAMRPKWLDRRIVIGLVESQSDLRNEPTIKPEAIRLWERTILRSDLLFSNSSSVQASLEKECGLRSEIVPTGVDTHFFTPDWDRPPNPRVRVLFVGSLRPFKGAQLLLRAAIQFPNADFVIVGEGMLASELQDRARQEKLANVTLTGSLKAGPLRRQYQQADILLFPSKWEGSPKVILEAAACGLPIIARRDYRPETAIDGITGYLGGSDDELVNSLGKLMASDQLRRDMGRASREHSERFDWDLITRQWEGIFLRVVSERRKAART